MDDDSVMRDLFRRLQIICELAERHGIEQLVTTDIREARTLLMLTQLLGIGVPRPPPNDNDPPMAA